MKFFVAFALVVVSVIAEPPVKVFFARYPTPQYQQTQFVPLPLAAAKPARLEVPQYFGPQPTTPEPEKNSTQDAEDIDQQYDPKAVQNKSTGKNEQSEKLIQNEQLEEGAYYLYHPSGVLQKVVYSTSNNPAKMAFNAQLQLQNVEPISQPIYTYDPNSFVLQEIQL